MELNDVELRCHAYFPLDEISNNTHITLRVINCNDRSNTQAMVPFNCEDV